MLKCSFQENIKEKDETVVFGFCPIEKFAKINCFLGVKFHPNFIFLNFCFEGAVF